VYAEETLRDGRVPRRGRRGHPWGQYTDDGQLARELVRSVIDAGGFDPAHYAGREREYCHMEKMANFGAIPTATGFTVACFPVKVHRGSGGWCRPVAIVAD